MAGFFLFENMPKVFYFLVKKQKIMFHMLK